ncbi:hypothetical protein [Candidatus Ichthyocystis sparus]|uniref:hypothetical protein n=1 Tax=Candidatus Ichthyocystis sparus TaxID=1561004 RepID=UPI000B8421CC|nr:hypothetical protein [Candidatus Ichthyocystis sparus]
MNSVNPNQERGISQNAQTDASGGAEGGMSVSSDSESEKPRASSSSSVESSPSYELNISVGNRELQNRAATNVQSENSDMYDDHIYEELSYSFENRAKGAKGAKGRLAKIREKIKSGANKLRTRIMGANHKSKSEPNIPSKLGVSSKLGKSDIRERSQSAPDLSPRNNDVIGEITFHPSEEHIYESIDSVYQESQGGNSTYYGSALSNLSSRSMLEEEAYINTGIRERSQSAPDLSPRNNDVLRESALSAMEHTYESIDSVYLESQDNGSEYYESALSSQESQDGNSTYYGSARSVISNDSILDEYDETASVNSASIPSDGEVAIDSVLQNSPVEEEATPIYQNYPVEAEADSSYQNYPVEAETDSAYQNYPVEIETTEYSHPRSSNTPRPMYPRKNEAKDDTLP